ncbi:YceD family protein [Mesobacterium pallidum]|uniref:YceD family protein n=1 Tax=Mesobacterium pallidum TaxID=2872037 RepID=UPI001EE1D109|nr:DUF177 domain-containing protein [Mesobacterium pallidum]
MKPIRTSDLADNRPREIALRPGADRLKAIAAELGLSDLRKLNFAGRLSPAGKRDWQLEAHLGATVVQPCVVSLIPVTTRIEEDVTRRYTRDMPDPGDADEVEMPEDDTLEPLGAEIDIEAAMIEALALALPPYPRADGAALDDATFTEPGKAAMSDDDVKPFAGLAALRDKLDGGDKG